MIRGNHGLTRMMTRNAFLFLAMLAFIPAAYAQFKCTQERLAAPMRAFNEYGVLILAGFIEPPVRDSGSERIINAIMRGGYNEIHLCSGGGIVEQGYAMGQAFAERRAKVKVPNGFYCGSACTNAFLGGYLRTIEKQARFMVHASSAVSRWRPDDKKIVNGEARDIIICQSDDGSPATVTHAACRQIADIAGRSGVEEVKFRFIDDRQPSVVVVPIRSFGTPLSAQFLRAYGEAKAKDLIGSTVKMVQYYQTMLNDERQQAAALYRVAVDDYNWKGVYGTDGFRAGEGDVARLAAAGDKYARFVLWQQILTEIEVQQQRQVIRALRQSQASLGPGAGEALAILEATITCRIQSTCYLDQTAARQLGYHNFDED